MANLFLDRFWSPSKILETINKEIFLPQIQRGYEWQGERIELFFDSLVKGIPLGLVLLYQHDGSFPLYGRKFHETYDQTTLDNQYRYDIQIESGKLVVLDGQQRLQTMFLGIKGKYEEQILYHDVSWIKKPETHKPTFMLKKSTEPSWHSDEGNFFIQMPILYRITEKQLSTIIKTREERLNNFTQICKQEGLIFANDKEIDEVYDYVHENLSKILCLSEFFGRKLKLQIVSPSEISGEKNQLSTLLEIFIRFNQGGLRLEKSDLMFSVLKAQGWINSERELNLLSEKTSIPKDLLLKALMITSGLDAREGIYKAADNIESLKNGYDIFSQIISGFYDRISNLIQVSERIFSKFNFQIPVVYFLSKNPSVLTQTPFPPSLLNYLLVIAYNSTLRSDNYLQRLVNLVKDQNDFPLKRLFDYMRSLGVKTELDGESLNRDPILTFSLIQEKNWRPLLLKNRLHIDHIFPRARIDELPDGSEAYIDSIWNKYVVFQGDNIRKTDDLPEDYFIGERTRLKEDYILPDDPSLLRKENFLQFIEWRRKKITLLFKNNLDIDIIFSDPTQPDELSSKLTEESATPTQYDELIISVLSKIFDQPIQKEANAPIFRIDNDKMIVRASKYYGDEKNRFWYGIKAIDADRIKKNNIVKYAFLMVDKGIVMLPTSQILEEINNDNFDFSIKEGKLIHYHMRIYIEGDRVFWKLRNNVIDISNMFIKT